MSIFQALLEMPPAFRPIRMGYNPAGEPIELRAEDFYYHMHLLGLSGRGKSRLLFNIARQFLLNRTSFTLIDPDGGVYDALVAWLASQDPRFAEGQTVHLFNPADPVFCPGYNPIHVRPGESTEDRVNVFMRAVSQMLGGEDLERMQQYQLIFSAVLYALAERGLTVLEALLVLPESERALHEWLSADLSNRAHVQVWRDINAWSPREYRETVGSFYRRMNSLLRHPVTQRVFGRTANTLDLLPVLEEGQVLLVNLKGVDDQVAHLIGRALLNDFDHTARTHRRDDDPNARPHVIMIDECADYLSADTTRMLDRLRKKRVHLVLANQRIEQLREKGDNLCDAVMAGAQTKIIFGSTYKTGQEISDEIFGAGYDLQRVKDRLATPHVVGHQREIMRGGAHARSRNHGRTETEGDALAKGTTLGEVEGRGETDSEGVVEGMGGGRASTQSTSTQANVAIGISADYEYLRILPQTIHRSSVGSQGSGEARAETESTNWSLSNIKSHAESRYSALSRAVSEVATHHRDVSLSASEGETETGSWRESLVPVLKDVSTATYRLDEIRHESAVSVRELGRQRFFLKRALGGPVVSGTTEDVTLTSVPDAQIQLFTEGHYLSSGVHLPIELTERQINERWLTLRRIADPQIQRRPDPLEIPSDASASDGSSAEDVAFGPLAKRLRDRKPRG